MAEPSREALERLHSVLVASLTDVLENGVPVRETNRSTGAAGLPSCSPTGSQPAALSRGIIAPIWAVTDATLLLMRAMLTPRFNQSHRG